MEKVVSCPQSIVLGVRWVGQVVYRWAGWLWFKVLKGTAGNGQLGKVKSTPYNWRDRESVSSQVTGWSWGMEFSLMIEVDWALCQRVGQVCGAGCHLREGNDHLATAVPCEGQGWESEQEPVRLPQPFFVLCAAVPVMEFPHSHSKSV